MPVCPQGGQEKRDIAKFCLACATPLTPPKPSSQEERKVVSILFVDLVGFTARSHGAHPEDSATRALPISYGSMGSKLGESVTEVEPTSGAHSNTTLPYVR